MCCRDGNLRENRHVNPSLLILREHRLAADLAISPHSAGKKSINRNSKEDDVKLVSLQGLRRPSTSRHGSCCLVLRAFVLLESRDDIFPKLITRASERASFLQRFTSTSTGPASARPFAAAAAASADDAAGRDSCCQRF